jgi:hypothetical protein
VHDNSKDLKPEVPPDDMTLTMQDTVTRQDQWRWTSIDINPSATTLALTTPSQPNISPASMSPEARLSPIRDQPRLSPIPEQLHPSPIQDQSEKSPIEEQPRRSPPRTRTTALPAPDVMQAKAIKNVRGKSHP